MARYDRIARLDPPRPDDAYTGWLALGDLRDRERDADLGRRARLRFLAVRLIHRLARYGTGIDADSFHRQCDSAREELGQLPGRDPERQRLAAFLNEAPAMDPTTLGAAALALADGALEDGHPFAAEAFYRAAGRLAAQYRLDGVSTRANERIASLQARK